MMIDLLDKLIVEKSFDTKQVLEQLLSVYVIDEVHMVDADGKTSYYGLQRNTAPDGSISFDHNVLETPIVGCDELKDKPDSSPIAVFAFNLNRELMPHIADFMKMNDLRVMVIYHMKTGKRPGYIMFMNHTQSCITVLHTVHHDSDGEDVINLINGFILIQHLFVDTEVMFHTA